jgi:hypothetical protein
MLLIKMLQNNIMNTDFDLSIKKKKNNKLEILGIIKKGSYKKVKYMAADPFDRRYSFSGSGMPFHSKEQAFCNKHNFGSVIIENNSFFFEIDMPNSFYINLGSELIKPTLYLRFDDEPTKNIVIGEPLPFKSLTHPAHSTYNKFKKTEYPEGPLFYNNIFNLPYRSQEQILRDSVLPDKIPKNFWGTKPSL